METIYDRLARYTGENISGMRISRLAKKYQKDAAKIAYENNYGVQGVENAADSRFLTIAKRKIAEALEKRAESLNGNLPVISVFDALQIAKSAKDDKDMGLRVLVASLEKMWKKDRTANINAKTFLDLRDYYESNYPRSKVGKVFSEMGEGGYLNLPVADLIHIASRIQNQDDFENEMRVAGLTTNRPDHVQARNFVLALVNENGSKSAAGREEYLGNYGDVDWLTYGGILLFKSGGKYLSAIVVIPRDYDNDELHWDVYDVGIDKDFLSFVLDDPKQLDSILSTTGTTEEEFLEMLNSNNPGDLLRAFEVYAAWGGWDEFGDYRVWGIDDMKNFVGSKDSELMEEILHYEEMHTDDDDLEGEDSPPFDKGGRRSGQFEDDSLLRDLDLDGFRLRMWDAGEKWERGQRRNYVRYELTSPEGEIIFSGDDYSPAPSYSIDGDDSVRGLLGFLTLKPGDTDDEYFENYNDIQRAFAEEHAEGLSLWSDEGDDEYPAMDFQDWGGKRAQFNNITDSTKQQAYECPECGKILPTERGWKIHMTRLHGKPVGNPPEELAVDPPMEEMSVEAPVEEPMIEEPSRGYKGPSEESDEEYYERMMQKRKEDLGDSDWGVPPGTDLKEYWNSTRRRNQRKQAGSPGKFEGVPDELVDTAENLYDMAANGMHDREAGESETTGWYAGFDAERAIIMEDSQGFISIEVFDNANDYEEAWEGIEEDTSSYDEYEEEDEYEGPESIMGYEASRRTYNKAQEIASKIDALAESMLFEEPQMDVEEGHKEIDKLWLEAEELGIRDEVRKIIDDVSNREMRESIERTEKEMGLEPGSIMGYEAKKKAFNGNEEEILEQALQVAKSFKGSPEEALREADDFLNKHDVMSFGVEFLPYEETGPLNDVEIMYLNSGDTYSSTILYRKDEGFFISSWGDVLEELEREYTEETGQTSCEYCGYWTDEETCPACGHDTGRSRFVGRD